METLTRYLGDGPEEQQTFWTSAVCAAGSVAMRYCRFLPVFIFLIVSAYFVAATSDPITNVSETVSASTTKPDSTEGPLCLNCKGLTNLLRWFSNFGRGDPGDIRDGTDRELLL